ncbi:MAG: hypothetical protein R6V05_03370 [Candidatus Brocadiia bacterium]
MGRLVVEEQQRPGRSWLRLLRDYGIGLVAGLAAAGYGAYALMSGRTYLPGLKGGTATVHGSHGVGAALLYLAGGLFLVVRFFLHERCRSESTRSQLYLLEVLLLVVFVAAAFYVLLNVGSAG